MPVNPAFTMQTFGIGAQEEIGRPCCVIEPAGFLRARQMSLTAAKELGFVARPTPRTRN
jgi:hypothetical protein